MSGARDLPADLIERAAQALYGQDRAWNDLRPEFQEGFRRSARAALEAIADHWPTPTAHRDQLRVPLADPNSVTPRGDSQTLTDWQINALFEAGVLRDAAQVETEARRGALLAAAGTFAWEADRLEDRSVMTSPEMVRCLRKVVVALEERAEDAARIASAGEADRG